MDIDRIDRKIVEHVNSLALIAVRNVMRRRRMLSRSQQVRMVPSLVKGLVKEGRPGFLIVFDLTRTLALRGDMTISRLAEATGRTLSTASRLVDGLEAAGLVTRTVNPDDGRSRLVSLTEKGRKVSEDLHADAAAPLLGRLTRLTPEERETLERLLDKVVASDSEDVDG